jgi:hypothetical protein
MGCDIHIYVERKVGEKWCSCDYFVPDVRYKHGEAFRRVECCGWRNYGLFATLANVRNYGNTDYICEPKGLPEDASDYVRGEYEDEIWDAHSCSYFTLQELIDFSEERHPLRRRGMLSPEQQAQLDDGILPDHWCRDTSDPSYGVREWEEEVDVLAPLIEDLKRRASQFDMIYDFQWDGNDKSRQEAYDKSADIRIVFWFDN